MLPHSMQSTLGKLVDEPAPLVDGWQRDYTLRSRVWEFFGLTLEELCSGHAPEGWSWPPAQ